MGDPRPVGVFDSGIGGLTVLNAIHRVAPAESIIYLGDTARLPYGSKSRETVVRYSRSNIKFLLDKGVKMVVIACNTATAYALPQITQSSDTPVMGVIEGGVLSAVKTTTGAIGVIGTQATISSGAYINAIKKILPDCDVYSRACPLFAPLVEEGWTDNKVAVSVAEEYLAPLKNRIDTLVLGCTHYPLLKKTIRQVMGPEVTLIDSADETALKVSETLKHMQIENSGQTGNIKVYVTDSPERSALIAGKMMKDIDIGQVEQEDIF